MKPAQYLVDSRVLVALMDCQDAHHKRAVKLINLLDPNKDQIFLCDLVINDVLSTFSKRCQSANQPDQFKIIVNHFKNFLKQQPILCLYDLIPKNYSKILSIMTKANDHNNFHEAVKTLFLKQCSSIKMLSFK